MLRESSKISDQEVDLSNVTEGLSDDTSIPEAGIIVEFAEAVVSRDTARIAAARSAIQAKMSEEQLVDIAAVAAAFHGFVRVADANGIPYDTAVMGGDDPELRKEVGVDDFYAIHDRA